MKNIASEIEKTLFDKPLEDMKELSVEYLDVLLDVVTDSEIIEAIPVVKTFVSLYNGVISVRECFFAKKLMAFAKEIHSGNVSEEELVKRKKAIENKESWIRKEIEQIVVFLDRFDFAYKSILLAKLYVALINKKISSDKYLNMLPIIDKWQQYDNGLLEKIYDENRKGTLNISNGARDYVILIDSASRERLVSLGILKVKREVVSLLNKFEGLLDDDEIEEILEDGEFCLEETYELNYEGIILAEILFEGKVIHEFDENYFNLSSI